jgi:hypothetical protein
MGKTRHYLRKDETMTTNDLPFGTEVERKRQAAVDAEAKRPSWILERYRKAAELRKKMREIEDKFFEQRKKQ